MAYIGSQPTVGNFQACDAITTSATTTFNLLVGGVAISPQSAQHCLVSLNGVLQAPISSYTISGSTIVFAAALTTDDSIDFITILGDTLDLGVPSDGAVGNTQLADTLKVGKQSIWVPATSIVPTASNGCASVATVETTSGRPDMNVLDFDKDSDEHAQFSVAFPKAWNAGTVTFQFFWSGLAATTGVSMGLQGVAFADNDSIDTAYGTAVVVDDDAQGAVEELLVSAESGAITIAGSPGDSELCYFRIFRDVSDSNDDMAGDCRLHGVKLFFTVDAYNDA